MSMIIVVIMMNNACINEPVQPISFVGEAQGTYYLVTYYDSRSRDLQPKVDSLLKAFDMSVSLWEPESILSRINRGDTTASPDDIFKHNFNISKQIAKETDGAFDFTIGPLVKAWGFGPLDRSEITPQLIDSLSLLVDYRKVNLVNDKVIKEDPRISFDFNAVAQGHSVDLIAEMLINLNITNFIVDVGGEVYASGLKPDGSNWLVGIEEPAGSMHDERVISKIIKVKDRAIATSGNYRKYYEKDGMRLSHTIDPKTGYPVDHSLLSVTVMAEDAALADAYATAFMVMGNLKAIEFMESRADLEGYLIWSGEDGNFETYTTDGIKKLFVD